MWNLQTKCGFHLQFADSPYNLRIPLTICGFCLQLRFPQQLNVTIHMSYFLFVDSTNCSRFRKYSCGFYKIRLFWNDFERYNVIGGCFWNPKQQRRSKKSSNVADSAKNLILACCGIRLQCTDCTVWPRNDFFSIFWRVFKEIQMFIALPSSRTKTHKNTKKVRSYSL